MSINTDVQKPSNPKIVELFTISKYDRVNPNNTFRFCDLGTVTWKNNTYNGISCKSKGFDLTGQYLPRPRLKVTNIHSLLSSIIEQYDSFIGAKLTRTITLEKYLDALPTANPLQEFETNTWTIEQKLGDNKNDIEWELSFGYIEGLKLPRRKYFNNHCDAQYRGDRCNYTGGAVATLNDSPTNDIMLDRCGKRVNSCKLRNNTKNYAGVPGARFN